MSRDKQKDVRGHIKANQSSTRKALFFVRPQHRLELSNTDRLPLPSADRQPAQDLHVELSVRLSKTPADGDQLRLTSYKFFQLLLTGTL